MNMFTVDENKIEQIEGMTTDYPYCMHRRNLTDIVIPWHWHEELELGYLETGTSVITTANAEYTIHQGDGFFINTNVMNTKRNAAPGQAAIEINHIFHPVFLSGHFKSRLETKYLNPVLKNKQIEVYIIRRDSAQGNAILSNLIKLRELQENPDVEIQTRNLLSETWLLLLEELRTNFHGAAVSSETENRLRNMLLFIHTHSTEKLTLKEIAAQINVSEREVQRCFQRVLRQTPSEYLMSYRLNNAKKMLSQTSATITEIAFACGFSDASYFSKIFRSAVGVSPAAFRKEKILT